jgi:hypothetical protein
MTSNHTNISRYFLIAEIVCGFELYEQRILAQGDLTVS